MRNETNQLVYWDSIGPTKVFGHPVNFERLNQLLSPDSLILDYGCGYGRVLQLLINAGYSNLIGSDPSPAMQAAARRRLPAVRLEAMPEPPHVAISDASVDAVLLLAVLTCVPNDADQCALITECERVLRPGGLLYISDLWIQADLRNRERYEKHRHRYGKYGVFELPEGVVVRHHERTWIADLTRAFDRVALDEIEVATMNGHMAQGFQWFGRRCDLAKSFASRSVTELQC